MRQGNILNEATAVSLATFLGEAIRLVIQIVARQERRQRRHFFPRLETLSSADSRQKLSEGDGSDLAASEARSTRRPQSFG